MEKEENTKNTKKLKINIGLIKYIFSFLLLILAYTNYSSKKFLLCSTIELLLIVFVANIFNKKGAFGHIVGGLLCLLFNTQMIIMYFGSSFLSLMMMTNLESIKDISGNAFIYVLAVILVIVFSIFPVKHFEIKKVSTLALLSIVLVLDLLFTQCFGNTYSPLYAYIDLGRKEYASIVQRNKFKNQPNRLDEYFAGGIYDARKKPDNLGEQPNVILFLTEGLSQNIIDDDRNIMPNVREYESKSLSFTNYYNHTFATYRGIIGQLYSGYQMENFDANTLVSAQEIFSDLGYDTFYINAEPNNVQFTTYLENMGFDEVIGEPGNYNGEADGMSDKESFELLRNTLHEKNKSGKPFFAVIYTFGTHASFRSPDEVFGNENNPELDKFYNLDCEFGKFMDDFNGSNLADNSIVVFSTDHATYADKAYNDTFPDHVRVSPYVDRVPFFIYYNGVEPETVDVSGRNSLDLIPTVFDYLDISAPNYFLGLSLFTSAESGHTYDTIFYNNSDTLGTDGNTIAPLSESRQKIFDTGIEGYFIAKLQRLK